MNHITLKKTLLASVIASLFAGGAHAQETLTIDSAVGALGGTPADQIDFVLLLNADQTEVGQDNFDTPITATIVGGAVGTDTGGADSGNSIITVNGFIAEAVGNSATSIVAVTAAGQDGVASGLFQRNAGVSPVSASLSDSDVGVQSSAGVVSGTQTVNGNDFDALATGNEAELSLDVDGNLGGGAGAATATLVPGATGAPSAVTLTGEVLLGANQENRGQADISATVGDGDPQVIGLRLDGTSTADGATATVNRNSSDASATGNSLTATLDATDAVGADIDAALGLVQLQRSDVEADNTGTRVGIFENGANTVNGVTSTTNDNEVNSAATGNSLAATANVAVDAAAAADSAVARVAQELSSAAVGGIGVDAQTDNARIGFAGDTSVVDASSFVANGNTVSSAATGQSASTDLNAAPNVNGPLTSSIDQTIVSGVATEAVAIAATTDAVSVGFFAGAGATIGVTDGISVQASDNTVAADAAGNIISNQGVDDLIDIADGVTVDIDATQAAGLVDAGPLTISSTLNDATLGITDNIIALGGAGAIESLIVTDNEARSTASGNIDPQTLAGIVNNAGTVAVDQSQTTAADIDATATNVAFGIDSVSNVAGGIVSAVVNSNELVTSARGNQGRQSIGPVTGVSSGSLTVDIGQANSAVTDIDAASTNVDIGIGLNNGGFNGGLGVSAPLTVNDNSVLTENIGNLQQLDGPDGPAQLEGVISGTAAFTSTQSNDTTTNGRSSTTTNVDVGLFREAGLGTLQPDLTVNRNSARSTLFGNVGNSNADINANISGPVSFTGTQTNTGQAAGDFSAQTHGVRIGLHESAAGSTLAADSSITVNGNTVGSALTGNSANRVVDAAGVLNADGSLSQSDTQSNTDIGATSGVGTAGDVFVGANVQTAAATGASVVASANNQSTNLSGNALNQALNAGGLLAAGDVSQSAVQSNDALIGTSAVGGNSTVTVGADVLGTAGVASALSLVASNNAVGASITGNALSQSIAGGLIANGGLTSQSASQSNTDSQLLATTSNVRIGLDIGPGDFSGSSVVSGNSISASATGNSATIRRTR